jgi:hypothetical protein
MQLYTTTDNMMVKNCIEISTTTTETLHKHTQRECTAAPGRALPGGSGVRGGGASASGLPRVGHVRRLLVVVERPVDGV